MTATQTVTPLLLAALLALTVADCPDDYSPWFDGNCFKVYNAFTFKLAQSDCAKDNALLTSIHSEQENAWIQALMGDNQAWLGLICDKTTGLLNWFDGTPVDYTAFSKTPGKCSTGYGYVMDKKSGKWMIKPTYVAATAVCKLKRKSNTRCGDFDFQELEDTNTCVQLRSDSKTSWTQAEASCIAQKSHLVSIHDQETHDALFARATSLGLTEGIHIGLRSDASKNQLSWSDGSDVTFTDYARGFPNDIYGRCTALETNVGGGQWMSNQCTTTNLPFACGKPVNDFSATQAPPLCPENPYFYTAGEVFSPSYPAGSPAGLSCVYYLAAPEGRRVQLSLLDFESSLCCDTLTIYDGPFGDNILHSLSGKNPLVGHTVTTAASNVMRLQWTSNNGVGIRGWHVKFTTA